MKKLFFAMALTVACAAPAYSQMMDMTMMGQHQHRGAMMGGGAADWMGANMGTCLAQADKLGLTEEQQRKLTPIHREMQKQQARFRADLQVAELELAEIMDTRDFDLEKASAAVKKINDIKAAHHLDMLKSMKEVRANLTDAQFQKMKKMMPMKMEKKPARKMKKQ